MTIQWNLMIFHENPMKFNHFSWKFDEIWWFIMKIRWILMIFHENPMEFKDFYENPMKFDEVRSIRPGAETIVSGSDQRGSDQRDRGSSAYGLKRSWAGQIKEARSWNDRFRIRSTSVGAETIVSGMDLRAFSSKNTILRTHLSANIDFHMFCKKRKFDVF